MAHQVSEQTDDFKATMTTEVWCWTYNHASAVSWPSFVLRLVLFPVSCWRFRIQRNQT